MKKLTHKLVVNTCYFITYSVLDFVVVLATSLPKFLMSKWRSKAIMASQKNKDQTSASATVEPVQNIEPARIHRRNYKNGKIRVSIWEYADCLHRSAWIFCRKQNRSIRVALPVIEKGDMDSIWEATREAVMTHAAFFGYKDASTKPASKTTETPRRTPARQKSVDAIAEVQAPLPDDLDGIEIVDYEFLPATPPAYMAAEDDNFSLPASVRLDSGVSQHHIGEEVWIGRLNQAGMSTRQTSSGGYNSFRVVVQKGGVIDEIWGSDLKRAIQHAGAKVGDNLKITIVDRVEVEKGKHPKKIFNIAVLGD